MTRATTGVPRSIPAPCATEAAPPRIRIGRQVVLLNHDTRLYPHHLDDARKFDFTTPLAEVSRHLTNPNLWGLKNLSSEKWVFATSESAIGKDAEPGCSVPLAFATKINFGKMDGEILF